MFHTGWAAGTLLDICVAHSSKTKYDTVTVFLNNWIMCSAFLSIQFGST